MNIPQKFTTAYSGLTAKEIRKKVFDYYQNNFSGKCVYIKKIGIKVYFTRIGAKKLSYGGTIYSKKACLVEILPEIIEIAEYSNWGNRKQKDNLDVKGYLNLKTKAIIDGNLENIHLVIRWQSDGGFYYTHEINIYKNKKRAKFSIDSISAP